MGREMDAGAPARGSLLGGLGRVVGGLLLAATMLLASPGAGRADGGPPSVAPIAEKLFDAVVNISTTQTLKGPQGVPLPKVPDGSPFEEFFKDFFNKKGGQSEAQRVSSLGSGFVIDASGLIVTNNHVIADADEVIINFNDGSRLKVEKVVGRDLKTDIAVLKVKPAHPLTAVKLGDSGKVKVGDWVMAIGNPFGLGGSLTVGVISAMKRDINSGPYDEFLQTDAAINKGNSGGPLFNMSGELIGINTAIISPSGGSIGLGFAIPSNIASGVIGQLQQYGEMRRGWIGVSIQSVTDDIADSLGMSNGSKGALVSQVAPGGPADRAGIKAGDVIVGFDGEEVPDMRSLPRIVALAAIGKAAKVEVVRSGQHMIMPITIERLAEDQSKPTDEGGAAPSEGDDKDKPSDGVGTVDAKSIFGLKLQTVTPELRDKLGIADKVEGVVVVEADPAGAGATHGLQASDVIVEVSNEKVASPEDVVKRIEAVKSAGRKSVLLLISDPHGDIRFVAVPVEGD